MAVYRLSLVVMSGATLLLWRVDFSLQRLLLLPSTGPKATQALGQQSLSCLTACGIRIPGPVIKPMFAELAGGFLTTGLPGKSIIIFLAQMNL